MGLHLTSAPVNEAQDTQLSMTIDEFSDELVSSNANSCEMAARPVLTIFRTSQPYPVLPWRPIEQLQEIVDDIQEQFWATQQYQQYQLDEYS